MNEFLDVINEAHREVAKGTEPSVLIRREFASGAADVWEACTDPDRLRRWFLPVSGDLRVGGHYQLEGHAGGEILRCAPPKLLHLSWETSEVRLTLTEIDADTTELELEHSRAGDPEFWARYGPGSVGAGWDLVLLGLRLTMTGGEMVDKDAWPRTQEYAEFVRASTQAWAAAHEAAGASTADAQAAASETLKFFAPHAK